MKIIVAVKRVIDPYVKIRVKSDQLGVETEHVKMSMNPFDEIALEEALRLREKSCAKEVVLLSIGTDASAETLRHGLALGACRAILVRTNQMQCSLNIAKIIQKIVLDEQASLVLMGKQSIDGDNNQTPQMLAALLNWPQATFASHLTLESNRLLVSREIDSGLEMLDMPLPAVVSADLRLNEPRYATLPNIMKAKSKPLSIIDLDSLNLPLRPHVNVINVRPPATRVAGVKLDSVEQLFDKLQHEACVF